MTAAPFILWAFSYASSPAQGAALVPGAQGSLSLAGGLNTNVPTLSLAATAGVTEGLDMSLTYDTHAGIAHDVALSTRLRLTPGWAVALDVTHAFFAVEEAFGIHTADAPFGNGVSSSPLLMASWFSGGGTHHWVGA
ncbi:MAG: hypothetical protein OXT09_29330, partial [Myxococcales bacterium]|nr:hypothetical protein [Myxococcales bacterium]